LVILGEMIHEVPPILVLGLGCNICNHQGLGAKMLSHPFVI
jgi:hypothetical protein